MLFFLRRVRGMNMFFFPDIAMKKGSKHKTNRSINGAFRAEYTPKN